MLPETVEAGGEVVALLGEDEEAAAVAVGMASGSVFAVDFLGGVEEFQGKDGEAVNDEAGGLGVEFCGGGGKAEGSEEVERGAVELLGEVVAALVGFVDAALDAGELGVVGFGAAGLVFGVPKLEIGEMLTGDEGEKCVGWGTPGFHCLAMPVSG